MELARRAGSHTAISATAAKIGSPQEFVKTFKYR
jgi:hypothetical protein